MNHRKPMGTFLGLLLLAAPACSGSVLETRDGATDASGQSDSSGDGGGADSPPVDAAIDADAAADAPTDGAADAAADAADARSDSPACSIAAVWPTNGDGFTYESVGGFAPAPPADAGCSLLSTRYDFSIAGKTLTQDLCNFSGYSTHRVQLTGAEAAEILTALQGLRTTCPSGSCAADAPGVSLAVRSGGATTLYNSDFYAGCSGGPSPPFIAESVLSALASLLSGIVGESCSSDAGAADAGACVPGPPVPPDAGP